VKIKQNRASLSWSIMSWETSSSHLPQHYHAVYSSLIWFI